MDKEIAILGLAALAQSTRLDVFRMLVRHEPDGLPAGQIARELKVPHNTLSTHLAILTRAGLIRAQRRSRSIIYRVDLDRVRALTMFLLKDCCGGRPELKRAVTGVAANRRGGRPRGVAFLAGPTGVGKTELAKTITSLLFNDENSYIRFDMSEFSAEHADQRLIGLMNCASSAVRRKAARSRRSSGACARLDSR